MEFCERPSEGKSRKGHREMAGSQILHYMPRQKVAFIFSYFGKRTIDFLLPDITLTIVQALWLGTGSRKEEDSSGNEASTVGQSFVVHPRSGFSG
jgi:hypothetical protein